jgi:hypothetical protein
VDKQRKLAASACNRERNNQLLVDKLLELRTIRRNKLKAQGRWIYSLDRSYPLVAKQNNFIYRTFLSRGRE